MGARGSHVSHVRRFRGVNPAPLITHLLSALFRVWAKAYADRRWQDQQGEYRARVWNESQRP